ncbi:allophanate hydrolase, partial [Halomonas sp. BBD48]|nr:allophanate hydrolase [Halomonas sp. BBD48]
GYPRLGALTPLACARLAQCAPGESLHLVAVTPGQARQAYLEQWQRWQ